MAVESTAEQPPHEAEDRRERYGELLGAILLSFLFQGIAKPGRWEQIVITALLAITLVLAFRAANARPVVMRIILTLAAVVLIFGVVASLNGAVAGAPSRIANLLLVVLAPPAIVVGVVRSLRARQRVTVEAVFGVLCLYILLGMFFAFTYGTIDRLGNQVFVQSSQASVSSCLYFSFTTLTTVGYGDLTTASNLGHTLSVTEALFGQIYLVTVVAVLVSNLSRPGDVDATRSGSLLAELERLDHAVYEAVAATPTPRLDGAMRRLSQAANYSRLSLTASAILAIGGGRRGRGAATSGSSRSGRPRRWSTPWSSSSAAAASGPRRRRGATRAAGADAAFTLVPIRPHRGRGRVRLGVGRVMPLAALPLDLLAAVVGYSRVHTGVHYPSDVLAGALLGAVIADLTAGWVPGAARARRGRRARRPPAPAPA